MTIQGLINKIFKANQTPNNTVSWSGVNGLKSIQEDIVDTIRQRTFFTVPTTADLVNQGFNNAVLCYVQDHAFFRWEANGVPNGTTIFPANDGGVWVQETLGDTDGTVTSIGVSMPSAFTVSNSPVTTSGVIGITGSGTTSQYIDGTGSLQTFPSLPSNLITGTGTTNYVPKFTSSTNIGNSLAYDNGSTLLIGTTTASTDYSSALLALSKSNNYTYQEIRGSGQATLVLTQGVTANSTTPAVEIFNGYNFGIKYIGGTGGAFSNYPFYYYAGNAAGSGDYIMMQTAGLERLRIVNNGNVLIGTTTDSGYKLDVNGTIRSSSTVYGVNVVNTNGNPVIGSDGSNIYLGSNQLYRIVFTGNAIKIQPSNGTGSVVAGVFDGTSALYVGGNATANASAILETASTTRGFLQPRMTTTQRNAIATPATGLSIYNTTTNTEDYYNGTAWVSLQTSITNPVTGTGSAGQVAFWNGTSTQTGSSTFTWDDTNSRLIIGGAGQLGSGNSNLRLQFSTNFITSNRFQSSSTQGFQIAHYGTVSSFWRYNDGTGNTEFGSPINYGIEFYTNNTIKAFLGSTGNFIIGNGTTDAGYKLDVNGIARVITRIDAGNFTPGAGASAYTIATTGIIAAAGGYNLRSPIYGDSTFNGIKSVSNTVDFYAGNTLVGGYNTVGGGVGNVFLISNGFNPNSGSGTVNSLVLNGSITPTGANSNTYNYINIAPTITQSTFGTGTIRGFLYNPSIISLNTSIHRAIETVTGDVVLGSTSGNTLIGTTTNSGAKLTVAGSVTAATALARGVYFNNTLVASANNDVLVGLDITPTFTNGAFTGVTNWGLRVASPIQVTYDSTSVSGLNLNTTVGTVGIFNNISFTTSGILRGAFGINNQSGEFRWNSTSGGYYPTIYSNGSEAMRIATTGNVLIATTTDAGYKLDVNGTGRVQTSFTIGGAADGTLFFPNTTSGHQMRIYTQYASNAMVLYANGYNLNLNGAGTMTSNFCTTITGSNGSAALTVQQGNVAWTPVLVVNAIGSTGTRFNTNGNVLIGTTTDAGYKLDVIGTIRSKDPGSNSNIVLTYGTGGWLQIFDTTPTETIRLRAGGGASYINTGQNVLIGTTTDAGYKLDVNGTGRFQGNLTSTGTLTGTNLQITGSGTIFTSAQNTILTIYQRVTAINGSGILIDDANVVNGSNNTINVLNISGSWQTQLTSINNAFVISRTINLASNTSSSAIVRGFYYNPTITNLYSAQHRAIETTSGDVILGTTSGSVGIGANTSINSSAILDVTSTTKGVLLPRMTDTEILAIASPANGLMVYSTTQNVIAFYDGTGWHKVTHTNL